MALVSQTIQAYSVNRLKRILIIQTAFLGDLVLTLPVIQIIKEKLPDAEVDVLVIPSTAELLNHNSLIRKVIIYDKKISGIGKLLKIANELRNSSYDVIISPHRSARSALISYLSFPDLSISFDTSTLSFLYNETVKYEKGIHEIQRNLKLLDPLGISESVIVRPELFISNIERESVDEVLDGLDVPTGEKFVTIAPGSVWFTKRFPESKFINICNFLSVEGIKTILIGGMSDFETAERIVEGCRSPLINSVAGKLSVLESAELVRRSSVLLTNDSAPLHIGNAVNTPVYAIFGSTVPGFGFYPYGKPDNIFEVNGLSCRPCGIHGRTNCPVDTLDCMKMINESNVTEKIISLVRQA